MITLYWSLLAGGVIFAVISVLLGDLISQAIDGALDFLSVDFLQPMVIATAATSLGGAGILFSKYTSLGTLFVLVVSAVIAILLSVIVYFAYVKPMQNSENSTGFSIYDLQGKMGHVTVPIPSHGFGEVLIRVGAGHTNQIAASFEQEVISEGDRVVVVEVREDVLYVSQITI
jgi:membrane protein implicated in regulation of membrane protease activity